MPQINVLSPHVADLIAAGEVVERPASAVKELLENAVDAGARTVVCEIRSGGRGSIRITDDGCGMAPEDAGVCFLRHATSKLRDEHGLEAIGTLGFRGEALAAISSVSRITLTTRQKGAPTGVRMEVIAGDIDTMEETGCPEGTTIIVRDLFYNTPARQKFLSSDRSEGLACVQAALNCALGRPEVSFRCLRDGEEEFFSPGDGKAESAVYALLGRDFAKGLVPLEYEGDGIRVSGYVSDPAYCRGNRSAQRFFVNGRPIRSRSLQAALEQAYKNTVMVGKFPACVLYLTLPNGLVDVNVHPTKAEVRFAREKAVFDAVYFGTQKALQVPVPEGKPLQEILNSPAPPIKPEPKKDFFRTMDSAQFRTELPRWEKPAPVRSGGSSARPGGAVLRDNGPYQAESRPLSQSIHRFEPVKPVDISCDGSEKRETFSPAERKSVPVAPTEKTPAAEPEHAAQTTLAPEFEEEPIRYIGEAMHVYILLEQGDKLLLIDKHAAHERILFDKMRLNDKPLMSQELLLSETLTTDGDGVSLVENNRELFSRLGFALESFGENAFAVRAVPADIDPAQAVPLLEELIEKLREGRSLSAADVWERLAATVACKAAIKAGWVTQPEELIVLARRVLSGEVKYCPHGRPVMNIITRSELDKRFGRLV